jgi:hypothetical protein
VRREREQRDQRPRTGPGRGRVHSA